MDMSRCALLPREPLTWHCENDSAVTLVQGNCPTQTNSEFNSLLCTGFRAMRPLPFHYSEHVPHVPFPSHRLQFCILSRRTRSIVLNATHLHPISTTFRGHEKRFMDFSMAANADVAATDEVQLVTSEQTIHVARIERNRKHLSCVLALPTDLGACVRMPRTLGCH